MTKQEAKRILHERFKDTPAIYKLVVKDFNEYEGDWEEFVETWKYSEEEE